MKKHIPEKELLILNKDNIELIISKIIDFSNRPGTQLYTYFNYFSGEVIKDQQKEKNGVNISHVRKDCEIKTTPFDCPEIKAIFECNLAAISVKKSSTHFTIIQEDSLIFFPNLILIWNKNDHLMFKESHKTIHRVIG